MGDRLEELHREHKQRYGAPRLQRLLRREGWRCSRKRVARLMRDRGLVTRRRSPRRPQTTDSRHPHRIAENVVNREFQATAPNQKWAGDITYISTTEGWLYLAVVIDLFSRRVIGWAMSERIDTVLVRGAMIMALTQRQPTAPLLVHSDRGVQYAAGDYQQLLKDWSLTPSMSRTGNCWDNAPSESFFATLKTELGEHFPSRDDARASIFDFIECYYNRIRLHSSIGYLSPLEFEQQWQQSVEM